MRKNFYQQYKMHFLSIPSQMIVNSLLTIMDIELNISHIINCLQYFVHQKASIISTKFHTCRKINNSSGHQWGKSSINNQNPILIDARSHKHVTLKNSYYIVLNVSHLILGLQDFELQT